MAEDRRRRGWIGTLFALMLLVVVGFVCGALAGLMWEEPRLVVAYLSGEAETVDWSQPPPELAEPAFETPPVAAPPPRADAPSPPAPKKVAAAAAGRFAIQVGAFAESRVAEELAGRLRKRGYDTYVTPAPAEAGSRWRVRVGPLPERDQAERLARRLKRDEKLPTWILDEAGGPR